MKTSKRHRPVRQALPGFTLVEMMIVVAIIGLLAVIAIPAFARSRKESTAKGCINNLRQIQASKQIWSMENNKSSDDTPGDTDLFGATLYLRDKPNCPAGGTYTLDAIKNCPTCTIAGHTLDQ